MAEEERTFAPAAAREGSRSRRIWREIVLQLFILIVTLGGVELLLRLIDLRELRDGYGTGYALVHRYDQELGWLPIPNTAAAFTGSRTITIRHNSLGLRDIEHERTGKPRVLFVGDSFVWGYDVEAHERFTELLRADLGEVDIVNAGVNGYGTDQEYLLLNRIWDTVRPDLVVLIFCTGNDRDDNTSNMRYGGYYKPYLARAADGSSQFFGRPVVKSRHAYFTDVPVVRNLWLARAAVTGYIHLRHPEINVSDPTEELVGMMRDFVVAKGARFLVGLQDHDAKLEPFLQAQNISHTSFEGAEAYPTHANHWTPKGHALVAGRLRDLVARLP